VKKRLKYYDLMDSFSIRSVGSDMPAESAAFSPSDIAGLQAWFKFNTGQAVSQWDDQSGNNNHLKQATATNQPTISGGTYIFDGVDNFMKCDAFTLNQPTTVCLAFKQVTWTSGDRVFDGNTATAGLCVQNALTPALQINAGAGIQESGNLAVDTYGVLVAVFNGASSLIQINNGTADAGNAGANNMGGFTLGQGGGGAAPGNIQVKEVLIYSVALDASQRTDVYDYLNAI
jgi:hypothetical protein